MKFQVKIKPATKTNINRQSLVNSLHNNDLKYMTNDYCNFGSIVMIKRDGSCIIRAYNLQKFNRKAEIIKTGKKAGQRKVVRSAHWLAHYYDFDLALLKLLKLKVVQGHKNFKLVPL